jgi:1-acyl-sn-glycerol-3-phosphate acyltransferase
MTTLRALGKAIALASVTAGFYLLWLTVRPSLFASARAARRWRGFVFRHWARVVSRVLGMKLTVRGVPPPPPFFLVSNHLSYVDVVALASRLDCRFIAKSEVARWPLLGALARHFDTLFIDRRRRRDIARVNALVEAAQAEGWGVVLFPEGTSTPGAGVLPFKPGLLEPLAGAGRPVSVASVSYRTAPAHPPAREAVCWWGDAEFVPHLWALLRLPGFAATLTFGAQTVQCRDRKELARRLHRAVQHIFTPVVEPERPCATTIRQTIRPSGYSPPPTWKF